MLLHLLTLAALAPQPNAQSLLAAVPDDAYALVHCNDVGAFRDRLERNDWYRLLGSPHGELFLTDFATDLGAATQSDTDQLWAIAQALEGEIVLFDTGPVAGFVAHRPDQDEVLSDVMRAWLPEGEPAAARKRIDLDGAVVELIAWPAGPRAGHVAAFVDHPLALALYSGVDQEAVMAAVATGVTSFGIKRNAPLVVSYLAGGGGRSGGVETFVDLTPFIDVAEEALRDSIDDFLPDPTDLLGLEKGTTVHASFNAFPGTQLDGRVTLNIPKDTLAARLADTFVPLSPTLTADLPADTWAVYALGWDLKRFYAIARAAFEEAGRELAAVDQGIGAAKTLGGIDPIQDVIGQLTGEFVLSFHQPPAGEANATDDFFAELMLLGFRAGLVDGDQFQTALEKLMGIAGLEEVLAFEEIAGAEAFVLPHDGSMGDIDGGLAFLPNQFSIALARHVLVKQLHALARTPEASLDPGSLTAAAIGENVGACVLMCIEMTPLRAYFLPDIDGELRLPPLEEGQPARDPFDAQFITAVRRTPDGFELRMGTR